MAMNTTDVVVVGAGVVGCAIAYFLSLEGLRVHLMDQEAVGSGASAHATGSFNMTGTEFKPGASIQMARDSLLMSYDLVPRLEEETGVKTYYQRRPALRLALDEDEEALIKEMLVWQSTEFNVRWIDGEEVRQMDSRLTPQVRGAALEAETAQLDSYRFTLALAQAAEKHGTTMHLRQVTGIQHRNGKVSGVTFDGGSVACPNVVLAMGAWGEICQQWLDFPVPVRPLKGERLVLQFDGPPLPALLTSPKRGHMITRADGYWSVGSTGGRDYDRIQNFLGEEFDRRTTEAAKLDLLERAMTVLPALEEARVAQQLAGSRPASSDRYPIIGRVPGWEGAYLAVGHTTKGIHLAPITGRMVCDLIVHGDSRERFDARKFLPDRFAGQWHSEYESATTIIEE